MSKDQNHFLNVLKKLSGKSGQISLKRALKWSKIRFDQSKKELHALGQISLGKGRGGSIEIKNDLYEPQEFPLNPEEFDFENHKLLFTLPEIGSWEHDALIGLEEALTAKELISLVGAEVYNLLVSKIRSNGQERKPNKIELITSLIQIYNRDLLFNPEIAKEAREFLAKANKIQAPKRLSPGKSEALRFVKAVGLPLEMAGEPRDDDREPFIIIKARQQQYSPLQPFQKEIVTKALKIFNNSNGINRALISLPTGAGKTRTAVEIIHFWMNDLISRNMIEECSLTVWIAQTDELCEQAFHQFKEVWENNPQLHATKIVRMWGGFWADAKEVLWETIEEVRMPVIVICTINTLHSLILKASVTLDKALAQSIKDQCDFVIVDEAHHAAANTYQQVFEEITNHRYYLNEGNPLGLNLLGLTATPYRNNDDDGIKALKRIFNEILIPKESFPYLDDKNPVRSLKKFLQESEILSTEEIQIIPTNIKLKLGQKGPIDDLYAKTLGDSALRHKRREFIVEHLLEIIKETSDALIIYFGPTVEDAKIISSMLRMEGTKSAFINDKLNLNVREEIINDFKQRKIQVLCNCRILTAGFDAPKITHVILGWPTDSTVLFHQIIGRGLRGTKFGGTSNCHIRIFTDEVEDLKDHTFAHVKYFDEWEK